MCSNTDSHSIEAALEQRILRIFDEREARMANETRSMTSTTTIQETSNLMVTNRNVSIVNTTVAPTFYGNVAQSNPMQNKLPNIQQMQQQQPILAYNTFTGQHELVLIANNTIVPVNNSAPQFHQLANNSNQYVQNNFGYQSISSAMPNVIRGMPFIQNQPAPMIPSIMGNMPIFQQNQFGAFGSTINQNINNMNDVQYSAVQAAPSMLYESKSFDSQANMNPNISFHSSANGNSRQSTYPAARPKVQIHSIEEIDPIAFEPTTNHNSNLIDSEYINTSCTQAEMPVDPYEHNQVHEEELTISNVGSNAPMPKDAQNILTNAQSILNNLQPTPEDRNLQPAISSPIRSFDRVSNMAQLSSTLAIESNANSSDSGNTIDWNSIPENREFSEKLKAKEALIEQVEGFLSGIIADDELKHFRHLMNRACNYENIGMIDDKQEERENNISPGQTTSGISSSSYLERCTSTNAVNEETFQELSDSFLDPRNNVPAQPPKAPKLSIKINLKPYPKVFNLPEVNEVAKSKKRSAASREQQYSHSKRMKNNLAKFTSASRRKFPRKKTRRSQPKCGVCVDSDADRESDAAEFLGAVKTIAKRVRKRRRSCTEVRVNYNESDADLDLFDMLTESEQPSTSNLKSVEGKPPASARIDDKLKATILNEDLALSSDSSDSAASDCDHLPPVAIWNLTTPFAWKQRNKRKRRAKNLVEPAALAEQPSQTHSKIILRNTNPDMYQSNSKYRTKCILCGIESSDCANHYSYNHPNAEVYISRLSQKMLNIAIDCDPSETRTICWFCEKSQKFTKIEWLEHYANHMGINLYKCNQCGKHLNVRAAHTQRCAFSKIKQQIVPVWYLGALFGFCCRLCNYVQLTKSSIVKHLQIEHELPGDGEEINRNTQIIPLCRPNSSKPVTAPTITQSPKKNVPIQNYKNANIKICAVSNRQIKQHLYTHPKAQQLVQMPKNTNIEMYASNTKYNRLCVICNKAVYQLCYHYISQHPQSEVYISRISPKMRKIAIEGNQPVEYSTTMKISLLKAICLFCEKHKSFTLDDWLIHYASHMGQRLFECKLCRQQFYTSKHGHMNCISKEYRYILTPKWDAHRLSAFACKLCNYVQLTAMNIAGHLEKEHDLLNENGITQNIDEITLLPASLHELTKNLPHTQSSMAEKSPAIVQRTPIEDNHNKVDQSNKSTDKNQPNKNRENPNNENEINCRLKNVNIEMCASNKIYQTKCVLCSTNCCNLVNHYVKYHRETEVYTSRISSNILTYIQSKLACSIFSTRYITAICVFCEEQHTKIRSGWIKHYTCYTGEYMYRCKCCSEKFSSRGHKTDICSADDLEEITKIAAEKDGIFGYLCLMCNYVQMQKHKLIDHIQKEHDITTLRDMSISLSKIKLLDLCASNMRQKYSSRRRIVATIPNANNENTHKENTNKEMYARNTKYYGNCVVCNNKMDHPIVHYIRCHTESYLSRITQKIFDQYTACIPHPLPYTVNSELSAFCVFCEVTLCFKHKFQWVEHLTLHTGEWTKQCNKCNKIIPTQNYHWTNCQRLALDNKINYVLEINHDSIFGFVCNLCNYVQLSHERIVIHLKNQHYCGENEIIRNGNYQRITLVSIRYPEQATIENVPGPLASVEQSIVSVAQLQDTNRCTLSTAISKHLNKIEPDSYISSKMLQIYRNKNMPKIIAIPNKCHYIAFCLFCQQQRCLRKNRWIEHFTAHTTEYIYECNQCHSKSISIDPDMVHTGQCNGKLALLERIYEFEYENNCMKAYSCRLCNLVQLSLRNIRNHIELMHNKSADTLKKYIRKIKLIDLENVGQGTDDQSTQMENRESSRKIELPFLVSYAKSKSGFSNNQKKIHSYDYTDLKHRIECVLCKHQTLAPSFSLHFDNKHPEAEFFYSRISEPMISRIECVGLPNAYQKNDSKQYAFCPFCERFVTNNIDSNWFIHLVRHTNENLHECTKCKKGILWKHKHRGKGCKLNDIRDRLKILLKDQNIFGFLCKLCNYVQFEEARMVAHVENQHDVGCGLIADHYKILALINLQQGQAPIEEVDDNEEDIPERLPIERLRIEVDSQMEAPTQSIHPTEGTGLINQFANNVPQINVNDSSIPIEVDPETAAVSGIESADLLFVDLDAIEPTYNMESINEPEIIANEPELALSDSDESERSEIIVLSDSDDENFDVELPTNANSIPQLSDGPQKSSSAQPNSLGDFHKIEPKPWAKSFKQKLDYALDDVSLFARYKCMASDCVFTTASAENMAHHLQLHDKYFKPANKIEIKDYLECAYCSEFIQTCADLIQHIDDRHAESIFQCSYCFYRSVDAHAVSVHLRKYHGNMERIILICGEFEPSTTEKQLLDILENTCDDIVPIDCKDCTDEIRSFYVIDHYIWHIQNYHKTRQFKCFKCNRFLPSDKIKLHLSCHKICDYHCLHCEHSAMSVRQISDHVADKHSDKLMFAVARFYEPGCTAESIAASDRGKIIILNLAASLDPIDIRFRELELPSAHLSSVSPLILPQFIEAISLTKADRTLDSHTETSAAVLDILDKYTLRVSVSPILLITEFETIHKEYEELEMPSMYDK